MSTQAAAHVEVLVGTQEQLHELLSHAEATLFPAASGVRSAGLLVTPATPRPDTHARCDAGSGGGSPPLHRRPLRRSSLRRDPRARTGLTAADRAPLRF